MSSSIELSVFTIPFNPDLAAGAAEEFHVTEVMTAFVFDHQNYSRGFISYAITTR
jgi:hypothetical protein